jgi:hypothetical protein
MALLFFIVTPCIFITLGVLTAGSSRMPVKIFYLAAIRTVTVTQLEISLVFMCAAVNGFLSAYYSNLLFSQSRDFYRLTVLYGLKPRDYLVGRFLFFIIVVTLLAAMVTLIFSFFIDLHFPFWVFIGYCLLGTTYGIVGSLVGLLSKDQMLALIILILMVTLDPGWLQNPLHYSYGSNVWIIRVLPAHFPSQLILSSAFTDNTNMGAALYSTLLIFGGMSMLFFLTWFKMRLYNRHASNWNQ